MRSADRPRRDAPPLRFALDDERRWLSPARRAPSPNSDPRPDGVDVDLVIVHGISLPPGCFGTGCVEELFLNRLDWNAHEYFSTIRGVVVSSHLFVDRLGNVVQFVPFDRRAWHAGESRFEGRTRCNDFSIGIELEGTDDRHYEPAQYDVLVDILDVLMTAWPVLSAQRIVGHCDVAPGRKTDPGPHFDWESLYRRLRRR